MKNNFWATLEKPILVLAPMAGYTESPFRRLIKEIEPTTILVSELVSAEALRRGSEKTMRLVEFSKEELGYYCVQLFGSDAEAFIDAAKIVQDMGVDGIDLNFGCPSPKVVGSGHGSALLKDPCGSAKMIEALVKAIDIPVSVKMRLGFYNDEDLITTAKSFESAGICSLAIHGRTSTQKFNGEAAWDKIYQVKEHLSIPVIGNGDVTSAAIAKNKLKNLDGVMIGRAAMRNPWIFKQCRELFEGKEVSTRPPLPEQLDFFRRHVKLAVAMKGEKWAMIEMRKHFAHFIRGVRGAATFRDRLIKVETVVGLEEIFADILENYE